jgi:hypothetical protein
VPEPTTSLQDQLDAHLAKSRAARAPEVNAAPPAFTLPNAIGNDVSLGSMLERGPVVLVWYRGGW